MSTLRVDCEIGAANWVDKAAGGTVRKSILWPLSVTMVSAPWDMRKCEP
jgi:hypothetical protein